MKLPKQAQPVMRNVTIVKQKQSAAKSSEKNAVYPSGVKLVVACLVASGGNPLCGLLAEA